MTTWRLHFHHDDASGLAADDLAVGLLVTGADGCVLQGNRACHDLLGDRLPAGPDALAGVLLAAGVAEPRSRLASALAAPQDLVLRVGGRATPVRLTSRPLAGGAVLHLLHPLQDASEFRERQAELQSLIAHDLRSPLAVIQGYAGLLATGQPGPLNDTQTEFLAGIDAKIIEVTRLLDDFLDLSRLDAGALELRLQTVALAEVIDRICAEQCRAAAARAIAIEARIEPEDLCLTADPLRLKQVVENLVGNAVKYNGDGGWVEVTARVVDDSVVIRVADGGPGMEAGELATIFEPFARGRAGGRVAGSGLGLVVVQRLVALHGGTITAASTPGAGTVFAVALPARVDAPDGAVQ